GAGPDREVHVIHAGHVPRRQYRLLDPRLLLRGYGRAGLRLNRSARLLRALLALRCGSGRLVLLSSFRCLRLFLCRLRGWRLLLGLRLASFIAVTRALPCRGTLVLVGRSLASGGLFVLPGVLGRTRAICHALVFALGLVLVLACRALSGPLPVRRALA